MTNCFVALGPVYVGMQWCECFCVKRNWPLLAGMSRKNIGRMAGGWNERKRSKAGLIFQCCFTQCGITARTCDSEPRSQTLVPIDKKKFLPTASNQVDEQLGPPAVMHQQFATVAARSAMKHGRWDPIYTLSAWYFAYVCLAFPHKITLIRAVCEGAAFAAMMASVSYACVYSVRACKDSAMKSYLRHCIRSRFSFAALIGLGYLLGWAAGRKEGTFFQMSFTESLMLVLATSCILIGAIRFPHADAG